jgi:hypothetical protein
MLTDTLGAKAAGTSPVLRRTPTVSACARALNASLTTGDYAIHQWQIEWQVPARPNGSAALSASFAGGVLNVHPEPPSPDPRHALPAPTASWPAEQYRR